jgi:two-component system, chemotaxis family, chemotaxis protein CheY
MARILLVDDDRDIREFGKTLLATAGHDVFTVNGTLAAIEFLRDHPLDVLITDANMPQHSGFDLLRTLKSDPKHKDLTIAMLTGRRERKDIERALQLGAHDYIVKPLDPMLFLKKVDDLLERRPPAERPEVDFAALKINNSAKLTTSIEVASISELGLLLRSPHKFHEGSIIELAGDFFASIGIAPPLMKVLSSVERNGLWETRVTFVGAEERTLMKIRAWVHTNTVGLAARQRSTS